MARASSDIEQMPSLSHSFLMFNKLAVDQIKFMEQIYVVVEVGYQTVS